jgi:hypothetical protein
MLGIQFDDIYDLSSFDIVASDDQQQQEWCVRYLGCSL